VSVFDHGFLFGDGIYEGLRAYICPRTRQRRIIAMNRHVRRMQAGCDEIHLPFDARAIVPLTEQLLDANALSDAFVYWQVSRGTPSLLAGPVRSRVPRTEFHPTLFGYAAPVPAIDFDTPLPASKRASLQPDTRWTRGHVKSISLLGGVIAAIDAHRLFGADEAILVRAATGTDLPATAGAAVPIDGLVTEGTYTNVVIVTRQGELVTPDLRTAPLLDGVTRQVILHACPGARVRDVRLSELRAAAEVLLIGSTTMVTSVTHVDGEPIATTPGPQARAMLETLLDCVRRHDDDIAF
jgi:branched-subunit amino acid aminotransferase/4-amino-4-deoxychorismate lyase